MGQFTIHLPDNRNAHVTCVVSMNISTFFMFLPWLKGNIEEKTGYHITLEPPAAMEKEYHLFKTKEGSWSQDEDGRIPLKGETMLSIKKAIEQHEKLLINSQ